MSKITFTERAFAEYLYWQSQDKKTLKRINALLKDISRSPYEGIGKPEGLKENLSGYWSRRIDDVNRLVYRIENDLIEVYQCLLRDGRLPLILDGGECDVGVESTVISVVGEKPTLFRPGHITLEDLERALGEEVEVSKAILEKLPEGAVVRSPGMKYKHYAPKADVTLLDGTFEQFKAYVDAHVDQNPSCLCFTGEAEKLGWPCVEYGREGDGADQAKHIFRSLRALDEQGDGVVYARCPKKDGLSMAVYNRLIRAAAFRVIQL